jgi:chitinase
VKVSKMNTIRRSLVALLPLIGACSAGPGEELLSESEARLAIAGVTFQTVLLPRYVGAQNNGGGAVNATASVAQGWETFSLEDINGGTLQSGDSVYVRAGNGQYFQAVNGGGSTLNAASNNTQAWETFKVVRASGTGTVANGDVIGLQTSNGKWVSAQNGGGGSVYAYGNALGSWEQLKIGGLSSSTPSPVTIAGVTLRTSSQSRYVGAQNNGGGAVNATATVAQGWETFSIVDVNGGTLQSGDSVYVRAGNGQYFQAVNGGGSTLNAASNNTQAWETFKVVRASGAGTVSHGDTIGLQTSSGKWVSAENGGGGTVNANGAGLGSFESFAYGIGSTTPAPTRTRVVGYVPNWYGSYASWATKVDFDKVTHVNLAFALADGNGKLGLAPDADVDAFVSAAHAKGVKVFPSLCGGGGDDQIVPFYEPAKVDAFVSEIVGYAQARKFDGIDVDVEAPDRMGSKYDTFIAKLIAKAKPLGLPVTAAVAQWMQYGMSDTTLRSFDFINVMSYDNTGTWTGAGEHSSYQQAVDALSYYSNKGVAKDKIVLGLPFYGYCWGSCSGASSNYILYKDILAKYPDAWNADWIDKDGAKYSYNGTATIGKKTDLGQQYGGLMIWELAGDVSSTSSTSLLRALDTAAR